MWRHCNIHQGLGRGCVPEETRPSHRKSPGTGVVGTKLQAVSSIFKTGIIRAPPPKLLVAGTRETWFSTEFQNLGLFYQSTKAHKWSIFFFFIRNCDLEFSSEKNVFSRYFKTKEYSAKSTIFLGRRRRFYKGPWTTEGKEVKCCWGVQHSLCR